VAPTIFSSLDCARLRDDGEVGCGLVGSGSSSGSGGSDPNGHDDDEDEPSGLLLMRGTMSRMAFRSL
jgi:hypothetical protein